MKDLSVLLLQLAVLLLPGITWAKLDERFASRIAPSDVSFLIRVLVFGVVAYVATFALYRFTGHDFVMADVAAAGSRLVITDAVAWEIAVATAVGLALGVVWLYAVNYKWLTWLLQKIKATHTYGDEDVWDFTLNGLGADTWVDLRDFEQKIVYRGQIRAFSETGKARELVLDNVTVFDDHGVELFKTRMVYLARKPDAMTIEFPTFGATP